MTSSTSTMIEFLQDRLYLSAFDSPPSKSAHPHLRFFTVDGLLIYNAFHHDFGPLHIGHLYRFAIILHEILSDPEMSTKPIVFYSRTDERSRANAACILACYMVLVQNWPPHLAIAPLAEAEPPFMPFRDAGYSQADFTLSIQDFVYGLWRAKESKIIDIKTFDLEEYETYERVEKGDFNWICPRFIAFASPIQPGYSKNVRQSGRSAVKKVEEAGIVTPTFREVLDYFEDNRVGMIFRLNSALYNPSHFTDLSIEHVELFFEDGTCPPLGMVKQFIGLVDEMEEIEKVVAVHCKAGLGRTGCLIGAWLIYKYKFTANEVIAYMRIMRPGMVVGPQQHWLHMNQHHFLQWSYVPGSIPRRSLVKAVTHHGYSTPPRAILGDLHENRQTTEQKVQEKAERAEILPAPTPGQPRKAPSPRHVSKPPRMPSLSQNDENSNVSLDDDEIASARLESVLESAKKENSNLRDSRYGNIGTRLASKMAAAATNTSRRKISSRETTSGYSTRSVSGSSTGRVAKGSAKSKGRV